MNKNYLFLCFITLSLGMLKAQSTGNSERLNCPNAGAIIITEIMQNPNTISDENGEYFEIYNTTNAAIDLNGWAVTDLTNSSENFIINATLIVPPNGYAVLVRNGNPSQNGGIIGDFDYPDNYDLDNGADEISIACNGAIIDRVLYDGGPDFPNPDGASMELSLSAFTAIQNNFGSNWGEAISEYHPNNKGTPGAPNDFGLSVNNFEKSQIQLFPNPVKNGRLSLTVKEASEVDIIIFTLQGRKVHSAKLSNSILDVSELQPGVYFVKLTQNQYTTTQKVIIE